MSIASGVFLFFFLPFVLGLRLKRLGVWGKEGGYTIAMHSRDSWALLSLLEFIL